VILLLIRNKSLLAENLITLKHQKASASKNSMTQKEIFMQFL